MQHSVESMSIGTLFVISAPSGAGKTSLVKKLQSEMDSMVVSVSHTTRNQRPGEIHGKDYFFVDPETFTTMLKDNKFLEHAKVFDHCYGTSRKIVDESLSGCQDIVLEIDWQGARQVRAKLSNCISIFILPPSREALDKRLRTRGQDSDAVINRRMRDAEAEISHYNEYDYVIINDDFDTAFKELKSIVTASRLRQVCRKNDLPQRLPGLIKTS